MSEEVAEITTNEALQETPSVEKQEEPASNFYSFFNKVDTFISSTAQQIQSNIPTVDSAFLEKEKESLNKNIQKNFFKINEKMKTSKVINQDDAFQSTKLPDTYLQLEKQTDDLGKVLKKVITILETYEVEGYDYPPTLSDSLNEVWKVTNKFKLWGKQEDEAKTESTQENEGFLPRSFAQALSNTFNLCNKILGESEDQEDLINAFNVLKDANTIMDEQKENQDNIIKTEILPSLRTLYTDVYKALKDKRRVVENLRIELDSLRYTNELDDDSLEDQFISETSSTLSDMQNFVESVDIIKLLRTFNEVQLNYYKKCVEQCESSLSVLKKIESEYEDDE
ncbi:uncharacterized protein HGUI_01891 [Hanseniaspora guilliermondii]|uniref:BAR domain-containing protein n=1 Tax=Hanseniaspora guilliermondii TaxID=56406 RepID=A0A1L0B3W4_9ASCO|nr:uncharacterized protein HGUI_01891 [Hanseniaspora guilliermondii]